jgi:2-polyprenyl-3-methyl-5-hydroxy-6-metoxy-1,4-benzoquinol methylase
MIFLEINTGDPYHHPIYLEIDMRCLVMFCGFLGCLLGEERNQSWQTIWSKKGERGVVAVSSLHEVNGYNAIEKNVWEEMVRGFIAKIDMPAEGAICDFGCGSGAFIEQFLHAYPNIEVYGCDYASSMIEIAKKMFPKGTFWVQDITLDLPKEISRSAKVDLAISYGVFLYFNSEEDVKKAVKNMASIVKSGGKLFLGEINDEAKRDVAQLQRKNTHSTSDYTVPNVSLDHLFLSREFFIELAKELNADIEFVDYDEKIKGQYVTAAYRFNLILSFH